MSCLFFLITVPNKAKAAAEMILDRARHAEVAAETVQAQFFITFKVPDGDIFPGSAKQFPDKSPRTATPQVRSTSEVMMPQEAVLIQVFLGGHLFLFEESPYMPAVIVTGHLISEIRQHPKKDMTHHEECHNL